MTPTVAAGGVHELLDLPLGQILTGTGRSAHLLAGGWQQLLHLVLLEHAARDADYPWKSTCAHDGLLQYIAELTQFVEGKTGGRFTPLGVTDLPQRAAPISSR